jgi:LmbE family N-acetylglucosaminyl deacetylase
VLSGDTRRAREARTSAARLMRGVANLEIEVADFRDGFFPFAGAALKERFELLKRRMDPDLIFTHRGDDAHQDHRMVSELTWVTFRDFCSGRGIPKYDPDLGHERLRFSIVDSPPQGAAHVRLPEPAREVVLRLTFGALRPRSRVRVVGGLRGSVSRAQDSDRPLYRLMGGAACEC